jgi:hypothetical protein
MRTTARLLTSTALAAAAIGLGVHPAYAWDFGTLEVFPSIATAGAVITVSTTACGPGGHGVGDARALGAGEFRLTPGTHKDVAVGQFTIPRHTHAGTYAIAVSCKNGRQASGDVTVEHHGWPSGHVNTGVGGSVGPDTTKIAAGAAILAAAAVGGTVLLRRRASGAQGS